MREFQNRDSQQIEHQNTPELAVFLFAQNPIGLAFTASTLNTKRVHQEISLLENVLMDENANSTIVCLALQSARQLIENFVEAKTLSETQQIAKMIRRLKRVTKKSVAKRNRKFFSADRIEVKSFDKFLDQLITEYNFKRSWRKKILLAIKGQKETVSADKPIQCSQISTEIRDFRFLKTYADLEAKIEEFFSSTLDLNIDFKKALYDLEFRHCIQLALQTTSTTKDGALIRETKLVKLLVDDSLAFEKIQGPQPIEGMVEFNNHVAR